MDVKDIKDPSFLKEMSVEECESLASDIRTFLIDSVSKTGGHLASNLGVVELTIALHKAFNSPTDKIFFDVGHQSYIHKILTGRASKFDTLRQYQGLSGFEKRAESEHDVWEAGHSSTSLSAALGMAIARDLNHETYDIIPVIGDGAMSSGMSLEALNQIGSEKRKIIIVFNDNDMSITQNVGAMTKGFARLRTAKSYTHLKEDMKSTLNRNAVGKTVLNGLRSIKNAVKNSVVDRGIFGEFDLEYLGPVDGHNIQDLLSAFEAAKQEERPVVIHVLTKKGKGYEPCENDQMGKWHGVSPFNPQTGKFLHQPAKGYASWSSVFSNTLVKMAEDNKDIVVLTPAMISGSKLETFFAKYPSRSFDCGIAEEHAATLAAGLAISNKRPVLCIYSSFMQRAYDQINHDICRMDLPVTLCIDRAGLVGDDGPTHHGVFDISILRSLPNIILSQPCNSEEAQNLLYTSLNTNHPFAIRFPRGEVAYNPLTTYSPIKIGSWVVDKPINTADCIVCTYGNDYHLVKEKAETNNYNITVINCRFFKPLDDEVMEQLCDYSGTTIVFENDILAGGLGSAMLEWANSHKRKPNIIRLGIDDTYVNQGGLNQLRKECHMDLNTLFATIDTVIKK